MMRRKIHGLLGLRDRPPNYMRQFRMSFRALLARKKSKPSIALCAREVLGITADNLSKAGWSCERDVAQ